MANEENNILVEDFFDDPFMEACTRMIEIKRMISKDFALPPFMMAYLDRKNYKINTYNTYIVLIVKKKINKQKQYTVRKISENSGL